MKNNPYIVAEISANHGHDIRIIKETILKAKEIGCDAVKIQTYTPDTITLDCDNKYFQIDTGTIWDGTTLYNLYQEAYTPWEWHKEIFEYAKSIDLTLFSTPFDKTAVDLLEECGNPIYKIASFEITDIPLISYAASKKKPMIISTGIATKTEIREAVEACIDAGNQNIYLLKCTSQYPAKKEDANLMTMVDMAKEFHVKVGLSDHTEGHTVAVAATALGAEVIEKHFILDKKIGGPDASFSMEPGQFKLMIEEIRATALTLGKVDYSLNESKQNSRKYARSLFVVENVKAGDLVTEQNVRSIRPSDGLAPKLLDDVLGRRFKQNLKLGTPLTMELIDEETE